VYASWLVRYICTARDSKLHVLYVMWCVMYRSYQNVPYIAQTLVDSWIYFNAGLGTKVEQKLFATFIINNKDTGNTESREFSEFL